VRIFAVEACHFQGMWTYQTTGQEASGQGKMKPQVFPVKRMWAEFFFGVGRLVSHIIPDHPHQKKGDISAFRDYDTNSNRSNQSNQSTQLHD